MRGAAMMVLPRLVDPASPHGISKDALEWVRGIQDRASNPAAVSRLLLDSATRSREDILRDVRRVQLLGLLDELLAGGSEHDDEWWEGFDQFLIDHRFRI